LKKEKKENSSGGFSQFGEFADNFGKK